ncbi:hypothetical protein B2I19_01225 [Thermoplasmatales archaeon ARMAN]|nr:MAG: hypothetical protein B2I19_01225 [Thermoplasmatales archaeon ARMAN]
MGVDAIMRRVGKRMFFGIEYVKFSGILVPVVVQGKDTDRPFVLQCAYRRRDIEKTARDVRC